MNIVSLSIPDVKLLTPEKHGDHRGFFSETYSRSAWHEAGIDMSFVQDNQSYSVAAGTLRGLHFQTAPFAQDKLVRVLRGRILDVAVDLRKGSPTFCQHVSAELSAEAFNQILIPKGFAHGTLTLEPNTEMLYKVTNPYAPEYDRGLAWDDPALAIDWILPAARIILSDKDKRQPSLKNLPDYFTFCESAMA